MTERRPARRRDRAICIRLRRHRRLNSETAGTASTPIPSGTTAYVVNAVNQYTALTGARPDTPAYDLNGNTTALRGMTLRYDEADRLVEAADATRTIRYVYDGLGRRVERAEIPLAGALTATRYVYDGMRVVEELDGGYATLRSYTRGHDLSGTAEDAGGIGGLLALARPVGATWTAAGYHYDGTGNVTALVADDGTLAAAYTYGPYGERLTATGPLAESNPYQFSGKERDAATGLYYFGYRCYDPLAGRWLNRDPLQETGGLNLYAYVSNAPGTFMDPFGLCGTTAPDHIPKGGGGGGGATTAGTPMRGAPPNWPNVPATIASHESEA